MLTTPPEEKPALVGFYPNPHNPVYSQAFQHCAIFKHASVPCAHTRNLSGATASTKADRFGTLLLFRYFPMWKERGAGGWLKDGWWRSCPHSNATSQLNPKCDAHHLAHGTAQRDGLGDRTCKSVHEYDSRAT